jgi:heparan-alpha-glucosaminide N-acetyltransferase
MTDPDQPEVSEPVAPAVPRLASIDAYRGFVMFLMMAEVLRLEQVKRAVGESALWETLAYHQSHIEWTGCTLHDMIQPSFTFLVGAAFTFSLASRRRRGESTTRLILHAAWRALVLVALGIFLRSMGRGQTNYTFEDTLTQIGLGYLPLFLIGLGPKRGWWIALGVILVGYWAAFALYRPPGPDFDYALAGVQPDWSHNALGFAAHWNKNTNFAWAFDRWFLNLLPREKPFLNNGGGYSTLSFIPTLATMLLGLIAGDWLKGGMKPWSKLGTLVLAGLVCLGVGLGADYLGICPSVKRIWTPSWVLVSGGWCFLMLAAFYLLNDMTGWPGWSYPLRVIGRNSIVAYVMADTIRDFVSGSFRTHLGGNAFTVFGPNYEPLVAGAAILAVYWLILFWMDRRKIYLRV